MKKLAIAAIVGGVFALGSASAMADTKNVFPQTFGPIDRAMPTGTSDMNPFPKSFGPVDRSTEVAMHDALNPFPKSYGPIDRSIEVAMPQAESPFPKDNSLDHKRFAGTRDMTSPFPKDNSLDYAIA
jgi:hypothetical protein